VSDCGLFKVGDIPVDILTNGSGQQVVSAWHDGRVVFCNSGIDGPLPPPEPPEEPLTATDPITLAISGPLDYNEDRCRITTIATLTAGVVSWSYGLQPGDIVDFDYGSYTLEWNTLSGAWLLTNNYQNISPFETLGSSDIYNPWGTYGGADIADTCPLPLSAISFTFSDGYNDFFATMCYDYSSGQYSYTGCHPKAATNSLYYNEFTGQCYTWEATVGYDSQLGVWVAQFSDYSPDSVFTNLSGGDGELDPTGEYGPFNFSAYGNITVEEWNGPGCDCPVTGAIAETLNIDISAVDPCYTVDRIPAVSETTIYKVPSVELNSLSTQTQNELISAVELEMGARIGAGSTLETTLSSGSLLIVVDVVTPVEFVPHEWTDTINTPPGTELNPVPIEDNYPSNANPEGTGNKSDTVYSKTRGHVQYNYIVSVRPTTAQQIDAYNSDPDNSERIIYYDNPGEGDVKATGMTWNAAARYVNWLNAGAGGPYEAVAAYQDQGPDADANIVPWPDWTPLVGEYFGGNYRPDHPNNNERFFRNSPDLPAGGGTKYFIPSENEWHKAWFYDATIPGDNKYHEDPAAAGRLQDYGGEWCEGVWDDDANNATISVGMARRVRGQYPSRTTDMGGSAGQLPGAANMQIGPVGFRVGYATGYNGAW
jgi:hypothetical protein